MISDYVYKSLGKVQKSPVLFEVHAALPWQKTGIILTPKEKAVIVYQSGTWSVSSDASGCDADGGYRRLKYSEYPVPGAAEGALVGRVGDQVFLAGLSSQTPENASGELQFCPNDDLLGIYGSGLSDNSGSIKVMITIVPR